MMAAEFAADHPATDPWRLWGVPIDAALALLVMYVTDANLDAFLLINSVSEHSGESVWAHLTMLGDSMIVAVFLLPFVGRRPDIVRAMLITAVLATLVSHGLKALVDQPRPPAVLPEGLAHVIGPAHKAGAFPSGHTTTIFAFAGVLTLHLRGSMWPALLVPSALLVGISRIAVGVHWPLDVLGGAVVGWLSAVAGTRLAASWPQGVQPAVQVPAGVILAVCAIAVLIAYDTGYPQAMWAQRALAIGALSMAALGLYWRWRSR